MSSASGKPVHHLAHRYRREQDIVGGGDDDRPGHAFGGGVDAVRDIVGRRREADRQAGASAIAAQHVLRARLDRDADAIDPLHLAESGEDMGEQRPAADRHQAFVGDSRLFRERIEPAVPLGGEDDDGETPAQSSSRPWRRRPS